MKEKNKENCFRLNTLILTKVKVKLINYIALPARASNNLRYFEIMLGAVYVWD